MMETEGQEKREKYQNRKKESDVEGIRNKEDERLKDRDERVRDGDVS